MPAEPQLTATPTWFKSSYSGGNTTECVEVTFVASGVTIRDSKWRESPLITFPAAAWSHFVAGALHISSPQLCTSVAGGAQPTALQTNIRPRPHTR
ncbi:DUF397 domain-containing protein [Streptomyces adonidis]|uniref:DUF397 domain-containing protein n=1 Tax=Streptomyces adonidis TaxID=3231367 RepID=UPI0034DB6944